MKSKILKNFYEDNSEFWHAELRTPEYVRKEETQLFLQNELAKLLEDNADAKRMLEKYGDLSLELTSYYHEEGFFAGFQAGAQLILDVLS